MDRKGERWTAVTGMTFFAVCSVATGAAPSFALAVLFWALAGIGSAVVFASLFSYILKAAPKERMARTLAFFYGAFNVGIIAGGAMGGFIADAFGLAAPLFAQALVLVVAIAVYVRSVPPPPSQRSEVDDETLSDEGGRIVRDLLHVPGFVTTLSLNLAYLWVVATVFSTLIPLFASTELGMSPGAIGAVLAVAVAAEFVVLFPAGGLADRYGRKKVMVPSLAGLVVMVVVIGSAGSPLGLTIILAVLAIFSGFAGVPPAAMLSDIVPAEHSGRAVGAFRFSGDIGVFLGPLIVGWASQEFGFQRAFMISALVPTVALILLLKTRETLQKPEVTD